jgi:trimethylamine--corrinoid protein Co-methyltransferase
MKSITGIVEVLDHQEIEMIHQGAVRIVERIGLKLPHPGCLQACAAAGAIVNWEREVFTIPQKVLENFLVMLKNSMPAPAKKIQLGKLRGYLSTQVFYVDYPSKTRRLGLMEDNMRGIAVLEQLDHIQGAGAVVIPSEYPNHISDVITYQQMLKYSHRGGGTYVLSPISARYVIEMFRVLNRRTGYLFATVSPLQFSKEHVDIAMVYVENGMDLSIGPMVIGGVSAPVTIAGLVTLQTAEALASLFAVHAITGRFAAFNVAGHSMDLRTMLCSFGSPNQALIGIATAQMARFYGFSESWTNSGLTDSLLPDFQGGFEKTLTAVFCLLSGTTNIGCQGIVGADQGANLEQIVLDNEWIAAFNHIIGGVQVDLETIASDLIEQVGIGGSFINQEHTVTHMRQNYWISKLLNRNAWEGWLSNGAKSSYDRAHEFAEECVRKYYPHEPVLEPDLAAKIDEIAQCAVDQITLERDKDG